ncbi:MAG: hypothetical protein AAGD43_30805 [Pseudomonadota bacterium]
MADFDRTQEDIGNVVSLEHVNIRVPDQQLAILFYVMGLGLTRDPYLVTGTTNMWINVGRSQFHLPTGEPQVVRGRTGLVIPGRQDLLHRLAAVKSQLAETRFAFVEAEASVDVTCPWGNQIRCHEPDKAFGRMRLGMPYVEFDVPSGSAPAIAEFYETVLETKASVEPSETQPAAKVAVGESQSLIFREVDAPAPTYDGHHIAVYLANFSRPHQRLLERNLVSEESNQHQYRFVDIVDLANNQSLFQIEHEVRSMTHPLYAREQINRDPSITNGRYAPGHQAFSWAHAPE